MSVRSFLGLIAALLALLTVGVCAATAPAEDLKALIASAEPSPAGKALVAQALGANPAPSNYELAGIRVELKKILAREVSASVAPQATAAPQAAAAPEPSALNQGVLSGLIGVFALLAIKALFVLARPRGPY